MRRPTMLLLAAIAALFGVDLRAHAQTTLTMNNFFPPKVTMFTVFMKGWAAEVEERTNGRIKIAVPAASLVPSSGQWDMVAKGLADVGMVVNSFEKQRLLLPEITAVPFTSETEAGAEVALWRTQQQFFAKADEYKGVKLLGMLSPAVYNIHTREKKIEKLEDFKGLKIRVSAGSTKDIAELLGGSPLIFPGEKTFEAVSGGLVDAVFLSATAPLTLRYDRYIKFMLDVPLTRAPMSFVMNQQAWNGLSAADKRIVEEAAGEKRGRIFGRGEDQTAAKGRGELAQKGMEIKKPAPEFQKAIKDKVKVLEANWIDDAKKRNVDGIAALLFFRKTAHEIGAGK